MEKVSVNVEKSTNHKDKVTAKKIAQSLLDSVGITINGHHPWDIQVHNEKLYSRALSDGSLGLGEAYMDKWWDCERLDIFFDKLLRGKLNDKIKIPFHFYFKQLFAKMVNLQTKSRAKQVAYAHYDLGNNLFSHMLDDRMIYSCGYWKESTTLNDAQEEKLDLICQKLQLRPGLSLLDIGCGWGGLIKYAAQKYGVNATGITISQQQCDYAKDACKGLPVEICLQDYRDIHTTFDRVVSVGMFEHVGHKNYTTFMQTAHRALAKDGLFLLHTIGINEQSSLANEWITEYIFPNGMLPTIAQIANAAEKLFVIEDLHNFGAYYDNTLMAWYENFTRHWDSLKNQYDERFYRMWTYYLLSCAGSFRSRTNQLWQIVLSKNGIIGGYLSPR